MEKGSGSRRRGGKNQHKNQVRNPNIGNKFFSRKTPNQKIGVTGLKQISGWIMEEYLTIMKTWSQEVKYYLEMRDDATIGQLLDAIKLPIIKAEVLIDPAPAETPGERR